MIFMLTACATPIEETQLRQCAKVCKRTSMKLFEDDNVSCACFEKKD